MYLYVAETGFLKRVFQFVPVIYCHARDLICPLLTLDAVPALVADEKHFKEFSGLEEEALRKIYEEVEEDELARVIERDL